MSTTEADVGGALDAETPDGDAGELILLPEDGRGPFRRTLGLAESEADGDGFTIVLTGRDDEAAPYALQLTHGGRRLLAETVGEEFFAGGVARDRFVVTGARLAASVLNGGDAEAAHETEREAAGAIRDVLDDVRALLVGGSLHVADRFVRDVVDETEDVTFAPESGEWVVSFGTGGVSQREYTRRRVQMRIGVGEWSTTETVPSADLPVGASGVLSGDAGPGRWRDLRRIWMQLATAGDAPPETERLTAEELRERATLPGLDVDATELEAAARDEENVDVSDIRRELRLGMDKSTITEAAVRALGLADHVDDVDPDW